MSEEWQKRLEEISESHIPKENPNQFFSDMENAICFSF